MRSNRDELYLKGIVIIIYIEKSIGCICIIFVRREENYILHRLKMRTFVQIVSKIFSRSRL